MNVSRVFNEQWITVLLLTALVVAVIGFLGIGLKNVILVSFISGFVITAVFRSRYTGSFLRLFASSIVGGFVTVVASFIVFFLLKVLFVLALVLIALFLVGLIIYLVRVL